MQPNALSCRTRRQAESPRGHIKVSVIAVLVLTLLVGSVATVNALQQQEIPKFKPPVKQAKPSKTSDPFENYEGQQADKKAADLEKEPESATDPFESYEGDVSPAGSELAKASDPFESYEEEAKEDSALQKTTSKKPVAPPQDFGSNDLRAQRQGPLTSPPSNRVTSTPKRDALPPNRSNSSPLPSRATPPTQAGSLPPMRLARPTAPKQAQSRVLPPVQAAPLRRSNSLLPLNRRPQESGQSLAQGGAPQAQRSQDSNRNRKNGNVIIDPNLARATFNAPINPINKPAAPVIPRKIVTPKKTIAALDIPKNPHIQVAKTLLTELRASEHSMPTDGTPLTLVNALSKVSRSNRKPVIQQYWKTYGAWAEYRFAIDEMQWLQQVSQSGSQADRALLEAARSSAEDSVKAKQLLLEREQNRLNRYVNGKGTKGMPLPSDNPLVFRYRTQFDLYSTKKTMPEELRLLNTRLPKRYQLIGNRSATVQRCRAAVMQTSREMGTSQPAASLLQAMIMSREAHSAFIQTVVWYNQDVTEYALAVKPFEDSADDVVSMLITRPRTSIESANDTGLRQAQLPNSLSDTNRIPGSRSTNQPITNRPTNNSGSFGNGDDRTPGSFGGSLPTRRPEGSGSTLPLRPATNPNGFNGRSSLPTTRGSQNNNSSPPTRGFRR